MAIESPRERVDGAEATPELIGVLTDPRTITLLTTEHWSLLSARSLAYNEAFVRAGMFLTFLSMSFVALGLLSQASGFTSEFLVITVLVLSFDLVIGLTTYGRMLGANFDDFRAMHGMARIRHGYTQMAPLVSRYLTTPTHDDMTSVGAAYGSLSSSGALGEVIYGLTTSSGMIGLIVAMLAGVLGSVLALLAGLSGGIVLVLGVAAGIAVFVALLVSTLAGATRWQASLRVEFPAPSEATAPVAASGE
jgi:hypothetical protein